MLKSLLHQNHNKGLILFYGLLGSALLFKISQGSLFAPDSGSYLSMTPQRSMMYPIFLKGCQVLFGGIHFGVVIVQWILGLWGILHLATTLRRYFSLSGGVVASIILLMLLPYFWQHLGNYILTEALCYPLFLFLLSFLIAYLKEDRVKDFYKALGLGLLLTLTRSQFLFLWPAFFILGAYSTFHQKKVQTFFSRFFLVVLVAGMGQGVERSYNYTLTGSFRSIPFVGIQLITLPVYLSSPEDVHLFSAPEEKAFFNDVSAKMKAQDLYSMGWASRNVVTNFEDVYNIICHQIISPSAAPFLAKDPFDRDAQLLSIGLTLAKHHWQDYVKFYLSTLRIGFSGYWMTYVFGILGFLCFLNVLRRRSFIQEVFLLFLLMHLGNTMLVALFEPLLARYMIYTALPLWSVLLIVMAQSLLPKREA